MSQWHGGKGSSRRNEDAEKIRNNWERIFGGKHRRKALEYVTKFYGITEETARELYMDEVEATERLYEKGVLT